MRSIFSAEDILWGQFLMATAGKIICSVLLTCTEPQEDGKMEVEMQYEGEKWLAAYLIHSAQGVLEEEDDEDV